MSKGTTDKWVIEASRISRGLIKKGYTQSEGLAIMALMVGTLCYNSPVNRTIFDGYLMSVIDQMEKGATNA